MENNFLKIRKSPIHEQGIFTDKKISKNEIFYIVPLEKIFTHPVKKCAKISENRWVSDEYVLNFVNHSCEPNTRLDISLKQPSLVASADIDKNEEITVDYDLTEVGGNRILCNCKKPNCKGSFLRVE